MHTLVGSSRVGPSLSRKGVVFAPEGFALDASLAPSSRSFPPLFPFFLSRVIRIFRTGAPAPAPWQRHCGPPT